MTANSALLVSSLSFDTIRSNLAAYIANKSEFKDFDFADSALGSLLDLLAYNTYYNAFYANMASNEAFIDSAQFFDSVASRAKLLGYLPTSAKGATANVHIRFTTLVASPGNPTLTIPKNTSFTSTINSVSYTFVTPKTYTLSANSINKFEADIELTEGIPLTHRYVYSTANTSFVIPNEKVDVGSIDVVVTTGGSPKTYIKADDIFVVNSSAEIFYVEYDRDQKYRISFGDGVLGKKPAFNSTVAISYRVCNAQLANGANNFTATSTVAGQSNFILSVNDRASGGADIEGIESVRFNAPKLFETQNRAVTAADFQRIILQNNPDFQAVNVWGGEENDPPVYGKVYVAVKPYQGSLISSTRKTQIKNDVKRYSIQSIDMEMTDPTFLYIIPSVTATYDATKTSKTPSEIANLIAQRIISFESENFNRFDGKFWYSKFLTAIDETESSIVGATAIIDLQKKFRPSTSVKGTYKFRFNTPLQTYSNLGQASTSSGTIFSSAFTYKGNVSYLEDNGFGTLQIYYNNVEKIYTNQSAGTVDYETGTLVISEFLPSAFSGNEMKINVRPRLFNFEAVRNQLLLFADATVLIKEVKNRNAGAKLTTIATAGQSTTLNETGLSITTY
jgi:hypothetical protein